MKYLIFFFLGEKQEPDKNINWQNQMFLTGLKIVKDKVRRIVLDQWIINLL